MYNKANGDFELISKKVGVKGADLYMKIAIDNIKKHPLKFTRNYIDNVSRMLFDFPYSYSYQIPATEFNIFVGSLFLWASIVCVIISLINWKQIVYPVKFSLLITIIYLLVSGMVSAYQRQFDIVVPVFLFWIAFIVERLPKIQTKFKNVSSTFIE